MLTDQQLLSRMLAGINQQQRNMEERGLKVNPLVLDDSSEDEDDNRDKEMLKGR